MKTSVCSLFIVYFLLIPGMVICKENSKMSDKANTGKNETKAVNEPMAPMITVKANGKTTVFKLNNSRASRDLIGQLPLTIMVENFGHNEKIFYPPKKLNTENTPSANAKAGTLAYYAPWGDVVMFFKDFGSASGLYELGQAVSGSESIKGMSGTILIETGNGS